MRIFASNLYTTLNKPLKTTSDLRSPVNVEPTDMRKNSLYIRVYILWMNLFVQIVIPFMLLIILNTIIYMKIKGFESYNTQILAAIVVHQWL